MGKDKEIATVFVSEFCRMEFLSVFTSNAEKLHLECRDKDVFF